MISERDATQSEAKNISSASQIATSSATFDSTTPIDLEKRPITNPPSFLRTPPMPAKPSLPIE
ncbi:hypothetical protein SLEP1_g10519 [Rubroshorea leprosula]|uniref:Uncharacterized protein n=1 Tax=Rubroshorea leprosula TaxID=152421 RepID=A0AAV5IHS7_9ROSI|nr:hypothetical protein SLEP1_g10519 [Rubroshorea leprosula]